MVVVEVVLSEGGVVALELGGVVLGVVVVVLLEPGVVVVVELVVELPQAEIRGCDVAHQSGRDSFAVFLG